MDIEEIKTLTTLMVENDLSEIMIRDGEKRILIRRGAPAAQYVAAPPAVIPPAAVMLPAPTSTVTAPGAAAPPEAAPAAKEDANLARITSPMVGTFYAASDPDSPPFVRVGDQVTPETTICIIEAMKVFNEIKAEVAGTIESILIQNGEPVEFGQVLMTVRTG